MEAESHTSIVALRVVGGDEKGSLKSETVKMWDSGPRMTALTRARSNYKRQIRPFVREYLQVSDSNKNLIVNPRCVQIGCTSVFTIFLVYLFIQRFFATCFGRIWPSSSRFYMYINSSCSTIPPYTGQCLHLEVNVHVKTTWWWSYATETCEKTLYK
jgi:hypothetical protein